MATQTLTTHVVFTENGGAFSHIAAVQSAGGTQFIALCDSNFKNNNQTWLSIFVVPPGAPFPAQPAYRVNPVNKLDAAALTHVGHDLVVDITTHSIGPRNPDGSRPICIEQVVIPGIFV